MPEIYTIVVEEPFDPHKLRRQIYKLMHDEGFYRYAYGLEYPRGYRTPDYEELIKDNGPGIEIKINLLP